MKKLPLHDLHKRHNAIFKEYNGLFLPSRYGSVKDEYDIVKKGLGVVDFSHRGKLRLSGKEHLKFLQGMLSNDVIKLEIGKGLHATLLTVKGKMLADIYLYKNADNVLIDLEEQLHSGIYDLLLKFRLSYKAQIEDITEDYIMLSIIGKVAKTFLDDFFARMPLNLEKLSFATIRYKDSDLMVVNSNRAKYESFDIYIPHSRRDIVDDILSFEVNGIKPDFIGNETYELLRVEAGIPKYGIDMDDNTIPIEAGLWDALSFEKGCYIGQEVIARIKWRGHVNRHLSRIELEDNIVPSRNDKIVVEDKEIGYVTSSVFSHENNKVIAMGYIRRGYNDPGSPVSVLSGTGRLRGRVLEFFQ